MPTMAFSPEALQEWRDRYGEEYDDKKFWAMFEWLQTKKPGDNMSIAAVSKDPAGLLAHLKYYIDTVKPHLEYRQIEFIRRFSMFKINS